MSGVRVAFCATHTFFVPRLLFTHCPGQTESLWYEALHWGPRPLQAGRRAWRWRDHISAQAHPVFEQIPPPFPNPSLFFVGFPDLGPGTARRRTQRCQAQPVRFGFGLARPGSDRRGLALFVSFQVAINFLRLECVMLEWARRS